MLSGRRRDRGPLAIPSSLAVLDCLSQQIKTLEKAVSKHLKHTPSYEQWLTVDGIGTVLAQTIALETGHIGRFPTVGDYASYCRCVHSTKLSNGKRKGQGNVKNGNLYLGWPIWKRRSLPSVLTRKCSALTNASLPRATTTRSWRVNLSPISCHGPVTTSCATWCPLRRAKFLAETVPKEG